jgi:phenylacetate-CoA ligase
VKDLGKRIESLKAVWTSSAPLTQGKRQFLENVFGCPVYTQYGSCEFYWIASECSHQSGLHIASDIRHVDVVDDDKAVPCGCFGDLVVTDLLNMAFPLIKYRIGDRGRLLKRRCSCGLPFPMMDYVKGRISDAIITPAGNVIPGEFWTTIFDDYTSIVKSFQVHQSKNRAITIRYEPYVDQSCAQMIVEVRAHLMAKMGEGAVIEFVQTIVDVNDNGKTRFVVSEARRQ